jgi:hypothetical protein
MILRRLSTNLKDQNWTAIVVEFVMVVLGVFLGIAAANWNEERLAKRETDELLDQVDGQMTAFATYIDSLDDYYRSASRYGDRAIAGWAGDPRVSDAEFVIAAYQASQISAVGNNSGTWAAIFGAENLRDIEDPVIRQTLAAVMTFDYALVDLRSVATRYREEVRKTIPDEIQSAIRARCNDQFVAGRLRLPERCNIDITPAVAGKAAAALRARPELVGELQWHRAAVANQLTQAAFLEQNCRTLAERIGPPDNRDQI